MSDFYNKYPYTDFHELNLDWVLQTVKETVEAWEAYHTQISGEWSDMQEDWRDTKEAWISLKNWVENYFNNLDVQDEINNKLDEMAQDGTLDALLLPYFNAYKNEINALIADQDHDIEVLEARMDTFSHLAEGSTTGDAELMDGRVGANGITYPNIGDAIRGQYTELNDKISILNDIPITNIHSGIIKKGTNLLPIAIEYDDEYIAGTVGNAIVHTANNTYTAFRIEVTQGRYYFTNQARFTRTTDENDIVLAVADNTKNVNITAGTAKYLYISVADANLPGFMAAYGEVPKATEYIIEDLYDPTAPILFSKGYEQASGNMSNGTTFSLKNVDVKKNNIFSFTGLITSFTSLLIGRGKTTNASSYLEITGSQAIVHNYLGGDNPVTYTHGLTFTDFIDVRIIKYHNTAKLMISTNGGEWTQDNVTWDGSAYNAAFAESVGSTLTNCVLTWSSWDIRKPTWLFGDSYISFDSSSRWPYYLESDGFLDAILLSGYPGQDSSTAWRAFNNLIRFYGQPKLMIWCLGMNDGSDPDADTPTATWSTGFEYVKQYCTTYGIDLILATIPSVPGISHEGKNKTVRNSGYRYIDFAKAVGAQSDGTWYTGMLSTDNIHPTATGAKALYDRAVLDTPEITYI